MPTRRMAHTPWGRKGPNLGLRLVTVVVMLLALPLANASAVLAQSSHGCATRGAVSSPASDPGLVQDCETLLDLKGALRGMAPLNWSADLPISSWEGISVGKAPDGRRVTGISFIMKGLNGHLPPQLGSLTYLRFLNLRDNRPQRHDTERARQPDPPGSLGTVWQSFKR